MLTAAFASFSRSTAAAYSICKEWYHEGLSTPIEIHSGKKPPQQSIGYSE